MAWVHGEEHQGLHDKFGGRQTMRAMVLMIAAVAMSLSVATTAVATTKHHRHHTSPGVAMSPAVPYAMPAQAPAARTGACITDEGGGRLAPCDHAGGGGGGSGGGGGGGM